MGADKVLRMPRPSQCCNHLEKKKKKKKIIQISIRKLILNWNEMEMKSNLPDDGLLAGGTTSFGGGGDTLFVHVSLVW